MDVHARTREDDLDTTDDDAFLAALDLTREERSPFQSPALVATRVGEEGFVTFVKALQGLGVLDHKEVLGWLAVHGAAMRSTLPPLDTGEGVDEATLRELRESLR